MPADNTENPILKLVKGFAGQILARNWKFACAESCTGGLLAKSCTDLAGSSSWFECAYITYSNESKTDMLNVPAELINSVGAVSEQVAAAMVQGVLNQTRVNVAVSITGIAGPGGGTVEKPVGTVCFAFGIRGKKIEVTRQLFLGDREQVRMQSVRFVLDKLLKLMDDHENR
jgi:nicotinamide-nucleotide amidase